MVAATVLNQQLRFQGSAAIAMTGMLTGAVLNIFLDPLFIFVLGLGMKGAGLATLVSQMTSFLILFFYGSTRKGNIRIRFKMFSPSVPRYVEMFKGGFPALLRQGMMSVCAILINHYAKPYGDAAIAGISIATRVTMFAVSVVLGFGQGFQPVCGFNYGAKLYSRVRSAFWFCVLSCTGGLLVLSVIMAIFAPEIIALFREEDLDVVIIGAFGLRLNCISLPFAAFIIAVNMMTQTMGRALEASIVAFARQGLFLIPSLVVLGYFFGLNGIQIARPVSELLSLFIVVPIMIRTMKILSAPDEAKGEKKAGHEGWDSASY
jgi:Na+-driven multidrug efflux pump